MSFHFPNRTPFSSFSLTPLSQTHTSFDGNCMYLCFVRFERKKKINFRISFDTYIPLFFFFFSTRTYRMNHEPSLSDWTSVLCAVNTFTCSPCQLAQQALTSPLSRLHHRYHTGRRAQRTHTSRQGKGRVRGHRMRLIDRES